MRWPTAEQVERARRAVAGSRWRLLRHGGCPGAWNMAVDELLLERVAAGTSPPTLRFYGWDPPAVSLGRFQTPGPGMDLAVCVRRGWDVVRRPTGGRAVFHDAEVTYALVAPIALVGGAGVMTSYSLFSRALDMALLGLDPSLSVVAGEQRARRTAGPSCFACATASDSLVGGRKLVGAAQVRRGGALLQHGSILLRRDEAALGELFADPGEAVALADLLRELPPVPTVQRRLAAAVATALGIHLEEGELCPEESAVLDLRLALDRAPADTAVALS